MAIAVAPKSWPLLDYARLAKPRAVLPHFVTASAAMFLAARGAPHVSTLALTLIGGGLLAGSANALNSYLDRNLDRMMPRTRKRPLAAGRIDPRSALAFGVFLGLAGLCILGFVGTAPALLGAAAVLYYVLAYTLWLKRRTVWSVVIGSGAGALPPLIGWTAVTNRIESTPFILFAIIAFWTMPHFWSLGIVRYGEYHAAGVEIAPPKTAAPWSLVCAFLLLGFSLFLAPAAGLGPAYLLAALAVGVAFVAMSARLPGGGPKPARQLYVYSIFYIGLLFAAIMVDVVARMG